MKKKPVRKLNLHKESIRQLNAESVKEAAGGLTLNCSRFCTAGSCGHICP